jgi:hypothetical protein
MGSGAVVLDGVRRRRRRRGVCLCVCALVLHLTFVSRLPQYLITAMFTGAVAVHVTSAIAVRAVDICLL